MSNETKRDVFEGILEQYKETDDELIVERNPIDWAPQQSKQAYKIFLFKNRYNAALPDDLPVIPKAVGEYIRKAKAPGKIVKVEDGE
ncbi:hypothetical protein BKQ19_05235 [Lacticaseibacillus paracasei]|uniref:hypothetical protein n=1 Tax=Lacticaseibacillus paracasei TaxID=1597 RepID=UPI000343AB48|nr:hypothetical protein [Lacticaseibacillus paracasei]ASU12183.1 hypothetical protein BKQ19_05235 [Lacticaseibacillus paracasei]EPD06118.1 hypothetical protein Lpp78_05226 [Lacticaseibacillus paracasei subsp. paracasei CNCM I-2877]